MALTGRSVLITGAGMRKGFGMGRALAHAFAAEGARVVAVDINAESLQATVDSVRAAGGEVIAVEADVTDPAAVQRMVDAALESHGRIDVLVNHAGAGSNVLAADTEIDFWDRTIALNLTAPFLSSRLVIPGMIENGGGVIINTISISGFTGGRSGVAYTAAKHGMVGLTRNIAATYAKQGIRCIGLCPGRVRSDVAALHRPGAEVFEGVLALSPRMGTPEEYAGVAVFAASDAASFVNGAIIPVDGGWTAI